MKLFPLSLALFFVSAFGSSALLAADNPFGQAAQGNPFAQASLLRFAKPFSSSEVVLDLSVKDGRLEGNLRYLSLGKIFSAWGLEEDGVLTGFFAFEGQEFAYSFTLDEGGDGGVFESAGQRFRLVSGQGAATATKVAVDAAPLLPEEAAALFEEAKRIAGGVGDAAAREGAVGNVAAELARAGDWRGAEELAAGLTNDIYRDAPYFNFVAIKAEEGLVEEAMRYLAMVRGDVFKGSSRSYIPFAKVKAGDLGGAISYIESLLSGEERANLFVQTANRCYNLGERQGAERLMAKADAEVKRLGSYPPGFITGQVLYYLNKEDFVAALTALNQETMPVLQMMSLAHVAGKYAELGKKKDVLRMVDWAKRLAKKANKWEKASFLGHLAKVQFMGGLVEDALKTYGEVSTDFDQRDASLIGVIVELYAKGRFEDASALEETLSSTRFREMARFQLIQAKARLDGADLNALAMEARNYSDPSQLSHTLAIIAAQMAK